jgi:hypothetical protein
VGSGFWGGVQIGPPFGATAIGVAMGGFGLELQATTTPATTAVLTNQGLAEIDRPSRTLRIPVPLRFAELPQGKAASCVAMRHLHNS